MKILFDIGHPAHVHFFKNAIWELEKKGHEIKITAINRNVTFNLLNKYGLEFEDLGTYPTFFKKAMSLFYANYKLLKIARNFHPDIFIGWGSIYAAHVSRLVGAKSITFADNEPAIIEQILSIPFTDIVCTSTCYNKNFGNKHIRYNSYEELAYLHPNYFVPDKSVLDDLNLGSKDKFIIMRLGAWDAVHDVKEKGFGFENDSKMLNFIKILENYGTVFISAEGKIPSVLTKYNLSISPEKFHDLLYFAEMYIGEGATTAVEAAILGTPSIYVSSIQLGYIKELRDKYDLVYTCQGHTNALNESVALLNTKPKKMWQDRRKIMLNEKIDLTKFMVSFIENYPENFILMKGKNKI